MKKVRKVKAKICERKGRKLQCKQIVIKRGIWEEGAFDSYEKLLKASIKMAKKDGYATVIRRLNLVKIWNKNKNPRLAKRVEKVIEELQRLREKGKI